MVETLPKTQQFGYLILEDCRADNYKGWSIEENDIYGKEDYIVQSIKKLDNHPNLIATHAVGAQKCHIKKINEVQFVKDEQRSSIIWAEIIEDLNNGICLFKVNDYLFKTKDNCKNKSNETVKDFEHAVLLFKQTNLNKDLSIVGVYGDSVKKLFRKSINDCFIEEQKGIQCILYAYRLNPEDHKK